MTFAFNFSLIAYFMAFLLAVAGLLSKKNLFATAGTVLLLAGALAQTLHMTLRWFAAGRAPLSNMFESLVLFAWATAVVYLVLRLRHNLPVLGAAVALVAVLVLAYASTFESDIKPLVPALRSNWLTVHVFTCFLGYGAFAVAFAASISYLIAAWRRSGAGQATVEALDSVTAKTIAFGFLFLTLGIVSGSVWANQAWGSYWQFNPPDPKEMCSLVTWLVYALFLHCRFMRGWRGKRTAWISIVGFGSVMFTYLGVNFLLGGLHSYATR